MNPNRSEPGNMNMAILQLRNGKSAEARAFVLEGDRARHGNAGGRLLRARQWRRRDVGNVSAAYTDLQQATSLKPQWALPRKELARYKVSRRLDGSPNP